MIKFKNIIIIKRPLPDVFAFVSNFGNMPKWNYYVTEVDKLSDGTEGFTGNGPCDITERPWSQFNYR